MFSIGDFVFDTQTGANVQIMERIELWGYTSYKVFNPSTGNVYRATEEQLHMGGNEAQLDENYLRYGYTGAVKPPVRMTGNRESGHKETGMCAAEPPSRRRCSSGWAAS